MEEAKGPLETEGKSGGVALLDFFCIGFGAIVGVGWAVSINSWIAGSGGPVPAATGYIMALVLMIPVALCYCELCSMLPVSGGGMSYAFRAFGDRVAFISGWASFGAFITIIPWEAIYVVDILSVLFPVLKTGHALYTLAGAEIYPGHIIVGTIISIILYRINKKGVSSSAILQRVLCLLLVGAGILAMICAVFRFDVSNLLPVYENMGSGSHSSFMGGAFSILASVPFFLAGFETIPQGIESAGGNTKSVGKIVVLTVFLSCLFYALLLITLGGAFPWKSFAEFSSPAAALLFKNIYPGAFGTILYTLILLGAICGLLTTWNGFMMASSQILMAMARVSIVPDVLSKQDEKTGTPTNALKVSLVASIIGPFLGAGLIGSLTTFSAAGYVVSWAVTAFSLIMLRKKEPHLKRPYKIPGGVAMAWFAGILMTVLLVLLFVPGQPVYIGGMATLLFVGWMGIGLILYILDYRQRKRYSKLRRASILFASMATGNVKIPEFLDVSEDDYRIISFVVPDDAYYDGWNLLEIGWGKNQNVFILKIEHDTEMLLLPSGLTDIYAGDRVFAVGFEKSIMKFAETQEIGGKFTISTLKDFMGFGSQERQIPLSCEKIRVMGNEPYCERRIRATGIQPNYRCMIIGIEHDGDSAFMPVADTRIHEGDVLWILGKKKDIDKLKKLSEPSVAGEEK